MAVKLQLALNFVWIIIATILCRFCAAHNTPADNNYFISCGSSVNTRVGQRVFVSDSDSGSVTLTAPKTAAVKASPASGSDEASASAAAALYQTARVFTAPSSYSFRVSRPGRHFVRLHFSPFACPSFDLAAATFKVSTQDVVLMDAFTPEKNTTTKKEFLLYITRDTLIVTFVPLGGLAFVNAVEVVSVPDDLFLSHPVQTSSGQLLDPTVPPPPPPPLETAYRVNVGGPAVAADGDTLWREWATDEQCCLVVGAAVTREVSYYNGSRRLNYLAGEATRDDAPDAVYATARELTVSSSTSGWVDPSARQMTWQFDVDKQQQQPSSARYLIRFHLCDIVTRRAPAADQHRLRVDVYVDSYTVVKDLDLAAIGNGALAFPYYRDFVLDSSSPSGKIVVYVGSSSVMNSTSGSDVPGPILNGIEIMKMHFSSGSVVVVEPGSKTTQQHLAVVLGSICGAVAVVVSVAAVLVVFLRKKEQKVLPTPSSSSRSQSPTTPWMPLLDRLSLRSRRPGAATNGAAGPSTKSTVDGDDMPTGGAIVSPAPTSYRRSSLAVIRDATNGFDERLVIGVGGFGKVYRATLPDPNGGTVTVAAKRASPESRQGIREFRTEIELLSGLRHRHLVSLVGYCDDGDEMILLYEYMAHGSLRSRLYGGGAAALSWAQRLEACAGAARGLLYLHTAMRKPVIHRDVKSSNILLDGDLAAKVADFGLSKTWPEPELDDETHVSTAVRGSFGYVDPEYARTRRLTAKSDVYSLGVVLLEAVCARPVVDPRLPAPMVSLVEWAMHWQRRGELEKVVDRRIAADVRPQALRKYGETAARCLAERGKDRPDMEEVVWSLQFVMRLQQDDGGGFEFSDVDSLSLVRELMPQAAVVMGSRRRSSRQNQNEDGGEERQGEGVTDTDADFTDVDVSMRGVFWQMVNVGGR